MAVAALETWIQLPQELLRLQWPGCSGGAAADLLSSGQERPCCPGPSRPLPVPGEAGSWAVSRRPVLRGLCCWILAPGRIATSLRSHRPSPSELLPELRIPL